MTGGPEGDYFPDNYPAAVELVLAVHGGDVGTIERLLSEHPDLPGWRIGKPAGFRTALHMVTDWPGYFPRGPQIARLLLAAGADPSPPCAPGPSETPLHWAASNDDLEVAAALIDGGANLETPGGSIGTPLDNAVGYGCWNVARLLVDRGATVDAPWQAAALGMLGRLEQLLGDAPDPAVVSQAFWHACAGAQRRAAEYLLSRGADLNWVPDYAEGTPLDAATGEGTRRENVITWLRELGVQSARSDDEGSR